jgi:hypothetical protein
VAQAQYVHYVFENVFDSLLCVDIEKGVYETVSSSHVTTGVWNSPEVTDGVDEGLPFMNILGGADLSSSSSSCSSLLALFT